MSIVILDSEAVSALHSSGKKTRTVMSMFETQRVTRRAPLRRTFIVPTTVRVEAGWDRTSPASAAANRHPIIDQELNGRTADVAARLRKDLGVFPADAHIGAVVHSLPVGTEVSVLTSDPDDIAAVTDGRARIIRI